MLKALTVSQFNEYFKTNIRHDPILSRVHIAGELANIRRNNDHLYFSLKEGTDIIDCAIYYVDDKDIDFKIDEGLEVYVKGTCSYNNYSSRIVIAVNEVAEKGLSEAYLAFMKMKEDFRKKGYFDESNKKSIDDLPKNVGLITSKDGAAVIDFISVVNQIPNDIKVSLYPVKVQGAESSAMVVDAIDALDKRGLDVIVITRGGGSTEDLSTFNDKDIIEAVYRSDTPIIAAIGHKIDNTLIDLVADLSLQTPTEAGSYIIRNYANIERQMRETLAKMNEIIISQIAIKELKLNLISNQIRAYNPRRSVDLAYKDLEIIKKTLDRAMADSISFKANKLNLLESKLNSIELLIENRKQNIVIKDLNDKNIYSKHSLRADDEIDIVFSDGRVRARIIDG